MKKYVKLFDKFMDDDREKFAKMGIAMEDGSFPIETVKDLKNAIHAYGRAKDRAAAAKHIAKRAKALGQEDLIPNSANFQKYLSESSELDESVNYMPNTKKELTKDLAPLFEEYHMDIRQIYPDYIQEDGTPAVSIYTYNVITGGSWTAGQFFNQKDATDAAKLFNNTEIGCLCTTEKSGKSGAVVNKDTMGKSLFWRDLQSLAEKAKLKLDFDAILAKAKEEFTSMK